MTQINEEKFEWVNNETPKSALNGPERISQHIVRALECLASSNGVTSSDLAEIVGARAGKVHCFPGLTNADECFSTAYVISLGTKKYVKPRKQHGNLTFREAIIKIVQHMQGKCQESTNHIIFLCDIWDGNAYDEWKENIEQIKKRARLDAFLIAGGNLSRLNI